MSDDPRQARQDRMHQAEAIAAVLAGEDVAAGIRAGLVRRIATALAEEGGQERERCAELCRQRAELWQRTQSSQPEAPAAAREEARARANEAIYLADLIAAGGEEPPPREEADA